MSTGHQVEPTGIRPAFAPVPGPVSRRRSRHPGADSGELPALLAAPFLLLAYPIEAVLAEKLVTIVARGDTTTRDRDFADVLLLAGCHDIDAATLSDAIAASASFRQVQLRPVGETVLTLGRDRQREWQR